jgi:hypothetical protein
MGHAGALHLSTYAYVIESIGGERYSNLDELIAAARATASAPSVAAVSEGLR